MRISEQPKNQGNWFTRPQIKNNTIYPSYASRTADVFCGSAGATTAAALGGLAGQICRGNLAASLVAVPVSAVAGALAGAVASASVQDKAQEVLGAEHGPEDEGGAMIGGGFMGLVAGGVSAATSAFGGTGIGTNMLVAAGTSGLLGAGLCFMN